MSQEDAYPEGHLDFLAIGRSGVDLYPLQSEIGLEEVESFGKFLGGTAANVSVAAARYGLKSALVTGVGRDPFGQFVVNDLARLGVATEYIFEDRHQTPVTFCELYPPDNFPLYFYREPMAPDARVTPADIPIEATRGSRMLWVTALGMSRQPSRSAHFHAFKTRGPVSQANGRFTVLDLDYREGFWSSREEAEKTIREALPFINVAIGNLEENEVVTGETKPDRQADALLSAGVEVVVVKMGPEGALVKTKRERFVEPPVRVDVVNGLGAGDAFGGAFAYGLLEGRSLHQTSRMASKAGAYVATKLECADAMPTEKDLEIF